MQIKCTSCGHIEDVDKELFRKIVGTSFSEFRYTKLMVDLHIKSGLLFCCIGNTEFYDESLASNTVKWINELYPCPSCSKKSCWEVHQR